MRSADGLLLWNHGKEGLILIGDGLALETADLKLEAGMRIRLADEAQPGSIDLRGELTDFDVTRTGPYLPVGIMPEKVVKWLDNALQAGRVDKADVRIEGPVRGFPYRDDQGEFEVSFTTTGFDLEYMSGWPIAKALTADILFRNEGMSAVIREGTLEGLDVGTVRVDFADLKLGELTVKGDLNGPFPNVHSYLLGSPVIRGALDPALSQLKIDAGDAVVEADLTLPLKDLASRQINVDAKIDGGSLSYANVVSSLTELTGELAVRNADVFGEGLTGQMLGQPVRIDIAPHEDLGVRTHFDIQTTSDALIKALNLPLDRYVSGNTRVTGFLQFPAPGSGNRFWMRYESNLLGLAISLPSPMKKPAEEAAPWAFECRFPEDGIQDWYMQLGNDMSARMTLSTQGERARFRDATVVGGSLDVQAHGGTGLWVQGHFPEVSVDE